jgi:outer membrane protein TolC
MLRRSKIVLLLAACAAMLSASAEAQSAGGLDFRHAVELALKHSGSIVAAGADRARAAARYRVQRDAYVPSVSFGSGLGYSVGVPVTIAGQAPSIYNLTHSQSVFNLPLQEQIKAAHSDSIAANLDYADRAEQVILDTALFYIELDNTGQRLDLARQQKHLLDEALFVAQQRVLEGVGSQLESKRAELDAARVELRIADLESSLDVLRERLSRATGLPATAVQTISGSIPPAPPLPAGQELATAAISNSAAVRIADEHLRAAQARARAEHKMKYPSIDFAGQYAEFAPYLNYGITYNSTHNYSFGINLRVPIFNLAQNAQAAVADAEALHAEADAQIVRDQVAADAVRNQHALRQLQAQLKVNRLECEVAEANIDAVSLQMQSGKATLREQQAARAGVADRRLLLLQGQFELLRAQLQLLRQTGELRRWALDEK